MPVATGSPIRSNTLRTRAASSAVTVPSLSDRRAIMTVPIATASPCKKSRLHFSIACANVCPRLSLRRSSLSRSSRSTICALTFTARMTASPSSARSRRNSSSEWLSNNPNSSLSAIRPALTISASPARNSRSGSVSSMAGSQSTKSGWLKVPTMFLYPS